MADDKLKIDVAFDMFTPIDLVNTVTPNLGGALNVVPEAKRFAEMLEILENTGRGVYTIDKLVEKLKELKTKGQNLADMSRFISIWMPTSVAELGEFTSKHKLARDKEGTAKPVSGLKEVVGADFQLSDKQRAAIFESNAPFFNPAMRNTKRAEVFMNSMPSTVLAQLVPYVQVEFQFVRDPNETKLQALSQLKLLMGAVDPKGSANVAMANAHKVERESQDNKGNVIKQELNFVGMEAFTSPVTLTNPLPNSNVGTMGDRYVDVLDPFRPFATLEHVNVSSKPSGAGYFCYKKANLSLKIHDRSRLHEISDLIRARLYTGVTIWLTYGWRAPFRGTENPYFSYVNNNMLMREAYGIVNSSFSFDNVGQVTLNLELFTKGVVEIRNMKIAEAIGTKSGDFKKIKDLVELISKYRQKLHLDPPEGGSKEVRVFQILDTAESGEFPDLKSGEANAKIEAMYQQLSNTPNIDQGAVEGLKKALSELYKGDGQSGKYALKERYENTIKSDVEQLFREVRTGLDPFLPSKEKIDPQDKSRLKMAETCDLYNREPGTKTEAFSKNVVSFGKLFSVFALRSLVSFPETIDEVQVFFYGMNEQCGPISGFPVSAFPINLTQFIDQFAELSKQKGGDKITLEDFLGLALNAQFLDKRAIGYGLADFYKPYERGKEAELKKEKDVESKYESQVAAFSAEYGPFKQPAIETYIECSHQRVGEEGESDILQMITYSAKDASITGIPKMQAQAATKIMRIHVYDKQTSPHLAASRLVRSETDDGWYSIDANDEALKKTAKLDSLVDPLKTVAGISLAVKDGKYRFTGDFKNNQKVKNVVSKLVPTIRFGANGTTITHASLSSKAEPLLSTVQMIRSQTIKNTAQPSGAGSKSGLPLRVIPAQLSMTTLGNPLATMAQQYFVDFQTGTTLDNLYIVIGLQHNFAPGKFETQWTFGYADGYGVLEGAPGIVEQAKKLAEQPIPKDPGKKK